MKLSWQLIPACFGVGAHCQIRTFNRALKFRRFDTALGLLSDRRRWAVLKWTAEWSMSEYICRSIGARSLFATHYHELAELESRLPGVVNYNATVVETADRVIFLRKIVRGSTDNSYGIEVAKMAGMPVEVITRAKEILAGMEKRDIEIPPNRPPKIKSMQISLFEEADNQLRKAVESLDIDRLTPLDALLELKKLQELARNGGGY